MFHDSRFHSCTNTVARDSKISKNPLLNRYAEEPPYLDLEQFIEPRTEIDLIKCDIEALELRFLQNYPALV